MSIREEARQEAERRWPSPNTGLYEGLIIGFEKGAVWRDEQTDREPSADLPQYPAVQGTATAESRGRTHSADREPSEAEVRAGAFVIDEGAMDSPVDYPLQAEAALSLARDVILAAQEVRRG